MPQKLIKVVPDTNILINGLLTYNTDPRRLINLAMARKIAFFGCKETYSEFVTRIRKPKLVNYIKKKNMTYDSITSAYDCIVNIWSINDVYKDLQVCRDPFDDMFFQIAKSCSCSIIVSQDNDLLAVGKYDGIRVVSAEVFMKNYLELRTGNISE